VSTGLELWPLAIAIGVLAASRRKEDVADVLTMETRMRDPELLERTLEAIGEPVDLGDDRRYAEVNGVLVCFAMAGDVFDASFDPETTQVQAEHVLALVDDEYTRQLQGQTYEKLLDRAGSEGLAFESERHDGDDIVVTLRLEEVRA
jgi:hypothetical protein